MYVVMAGGGKVGRFIATDLLADGHDVTIIERIEARCEQMLRDYDLLVIHGDTTEVRYLEQARLERAEVFVATTGNDPDNFVACQLARTSFGVPQAISRINNPRNEEIFAALAIEGISSTSLISRLIREEVTVGNLIHLTTLRGGKINLVEVDVPFDARPSLPLAEVDLPEESTVVCVLRGEDTLIPSRDMRFEPGDQIIALTTPELEETLRTALLGPGGRSRR
ncbi:MAG: potassium transporter TrkA [Actinobacteria bacterium QS_8_72_14]|nr:MAG: potassium transporter TrkA [Actinobacteria bacterium QS_8_72_14]